MATFSNQAVLTYAGTETNSNVVTGELLDVLSVSKTALSSTYCAGERVTYIINVINTGTADFGALCITDNLGAYTYEGETLVPLSYEEGSLRLYTNGVLSPSPVISADSCLLISDLSVPGGGNLLLIYSAMVNAFAPLSAGGTILNTVRFSGCGVGTPLTGAETIYAECAPSLTISKSLFPLSVTEHEKITYTFVIQNTGTEEATSSDNVVISDVFDPILSQIAVTLNGTPLSSPDDFTYNSLTGQFSTNEGRITVPAATYERDGETGKFILTPGVSVLQITGTIQ